MGPTDGLVRGMDAIATGGPISVPVGENTLGRMFNVLGNPIDEMDPPTGVENWAIHRPAPAFEEQATSQKCLRQVSKSLTFSARIRRVVRSDSSAVQV